MRYLIAPLILMLFIMGCSSVSVEADQPAGSSALTEVSYPSVVDLSKLTPVTNEAGENIVIPAPQTRNSKTKLIHNISLDVSKRLSIDIGQVTLVDIKETVWPDDSLGCPMEGKEYSPTAINGYQVVVKALDQEYTYHTSGFDLFVWCNNGIPVDPTK